MPAEEARRAAGPRPVAAPVLAAALLLAAYGMLSLAMNPGGYLGTDTGAKVATLEVMDDRGSARPALGYWAEDLDPDGRLHPIYDARPVDGDWVHVTTLPMLELARPLYALGGYRLALLLPMLGGVGAAFAGRALARRTADDRTGWTAFWVVGLASPIAVYSLDFWEHAPGVACIVGAVALLAAIVDGSRSLGRPLAAGALLGLAATMRTESLVYALVAVGGCVAVQVVRDRRLVAAVATGGLTVVGFAGPWLANALLEATLGGKARGARITGAASGGVAELSERAREALVTSLAVRSGTVGQVLLVGGGAAVTLAVAVILDRRGETRLGGILLAGAAVIHVSALANGFGFVPGMLAAAPIGVVAVTQLTPRAGGRYALAVALGALPLVWSFQFLGGSAPQWAGRYILPSCIILVALGVTVLRTSTAVIRSGVLVITLFVTITGLLWLRERSHGFDELFDELVERPEDVIVARNGFLIREGGAAYSKRLWLTAVTTEDLNHAVEVMRRSGLTTFATLDDERTPSIKIDGADLVGTDRTSVVNVPLYLHTYELADDDERT